MSSPNTPERPTAVRASFIFFVGAAVMLVAGVALNMVVQDRIANAMAEAPGARPASPDQIANSLNVLLWTFMVGAVAFALLILLFANKAREGTRSARTVVVVLAAVTIVFQLAFLPLLNEGKIAAMVLAVAGSIALFVPSTKGYFVKPPKNAR